MVAKKGRPISDTPKDFMLRVRLDKNTLKKLDFCCEKMGLSRSEVVREGIRIQYDENTK